MKKKYIELRVYELLGIKQFKKIVIGILDTICTPFVLDVPKEKRKEKIHSGAFSYYMGNIKDFSKINKFKKWLIFNAAIHIRAIWKLVPNFVEIITGSASTSTIIITSIAATINLYCVMLQRYNWVRIKKAKQVIKPYYDKKRSDLTKELYEDCLSLGDKSYDIMQARIMMPDGWREISNFDELVSKSSLNDLRLYRNRLKEYKQTIEDDENYIENCNNQIGDSSDDKKVLIYQNNH